MRRVVPPGGSRAVQDRLEASLLLLILEVNLNVIEYLSILMEGVAELAMVDLWRRNPSTRTRGNIRPVAGEQPAVERGARLLLGQGLNIRAGNLDKNKFVSHKEQGNVVGDSVEC